MKLQCLIRDKQKKRKDKIGYLEAVYSEYNGKEVYGYPFRYRLFDDRGLRIGNFSTFEELKEILERYEIFRVDPLDFEGNQKKRDYEWQCIYRWLNICKERKEIANG